jgi:hypothetical protein
MPRTNEATDTDLKVIDPVKRNLLTRLTGYSSLAGSEEIKCFTSTMSYNYSIE